MTEGKQRGEKTEKNGGTEEHKKLNRRGVTEKTGGGKIRKSGGERKDHNPTILKERNRKMYSRMKRRRAI